MLSAYWHPALLTTSGRPVLEHGEHDTVIQDGVGLYQGDRKLLDYQSGRVYLTNRRLFFVNEKPAKLKSPHLQLELSSALSAQLYVGFLKSSPKVTFYMRPEPEQALTTNIEPEPITTTVTWVCPICYYSNTLDATKKQLEDMQKGEGLPTCATCGVDASWDTIKKFLDEAPGGTPQEVDLLTFDGSQCPRCTFVNHPSMMNCEMCGASLAAAQLPEELARPQVMRHSISEMGSNDQLVKMRLELNTGPAPPTVIRLSFRNGGAHNFYGKVSQYIEQERWGQINSANGVNRGAKKLGHQGRPPTVTEQMRAMGIHGLQSSSSQRNYETSLVLNNSLQDLENLLEKGKELINVGQKYQRVLLSAQKPSMDSIDDNLELLHQSQNSMRILDQIVSKNELAKARTNSQKVTSLTNMKLAAAQKTGRSKTAMEQLYIEELSRHISEFLVEENVLDRNGGLVTLYDLYTMYNEARGIDLVSPDHLKAAASKFEQLHLNYVLTEVNITQQDGSDTSESLYIVSKKRMQSSSVSQRFISYLTAHPGQSILQMQQSEFQINHLIIETIVNRLLNDGEIVVDRTVQGEFYYVNEITKFNWDDWAGSLVKQDTPPPKTPELSAVFHSTGNERSSERLQELGDLNFG